MRIRNDAINFLCDQLRKLKTNDFEIRQRDHFGTPEENTAELLQLVVEDFESVRNRSDDINLFIGRFFGFVLLIESKLESLLIKIDHEIESKMLGKKIELFRRLIRELGKPPFEYDIEDL